MERLFQLINSTKVAQLSAWYIGNCGKEFRRGEICTFVIMIKDGLGTKFYQIQELKGKNRHHTYLSLSDLFDEWRSIKSICFRHSRRGTFQREPIKPDNQLNSKI